MKDLRSTQYKSMRWSLSRSSSLKLIIKKDQKKIDFWTFTSSKMLYNFLRVEVLLFDQTKTESLILQR